MIEKLVIGVIIAVAFILGAWIEREQGVIWRASVLWRRVRAWFGKVTSTPPSE